MKIDLFFIIIPIMIYIVLYFYNDETIERFDKDMNSFLLSNNDNETLLKISKEKFSINKATILLNKFYETNNAVYISFALRVFVLRIILILVVVIGITSTMFFYLFIYLF